MNLTVNKNSNGANPVIISGSGTNLLDYIIAAAMFLYAFLSFGLVTGDVTSANVLVLAFVNMLIYFMAIFLYFGIARLAYRNRNYLLWGCGVAAFTGGYMLSGLSSFWQLFTAFSMLLFAGTFVGRLTRAGNKQIKVYIVGMIPVIIFTVGMFVPIWQELMIAAGEYFDTLVEGVQQDFETLGYGADAVAKNLVSTRKMMDIFIRIIPAVMVLSAVMQFTVGYMLFVYLLEKNDRSLKLLRPFKYWKIPFAVMPVVIVAVMLRLLGNDLIAQIGDNILAFLVVFYAASGLALVEFYLKKFNFSLFFKILFYIMMFFTQLIGFLASAMLGFIDSFADWRKVQQLNYEEE